MPKISRAIKEYKLLLVNPPLMNFGGEMSKIKRLFSAVILTILSVYILSCATVGLMKTEKDRRFLDNSIWIDEPTTPPKAIVILLHGLNLKPAKMDGWASLLSSHGSLVMRFALFGHSGALGQMSQVTETIWRQQFVDTVKEAQRRALELKVPIYFVGFSLGALVGLEWLAGQNEVSEPNINKMVLIAPAIATPWYSRAAVSMISWLGRTFTMPSRSPKHYRANPGTSVAAYQALFAIKKSLLDLKFKNTNVPTLILIDQHDELVPADDIKDIIGQHHLSRWQLDIVDNRFAHDNYGFRHLLVDEEAVGKPLWDALGSKVLSHLELKKP